MGTITLLLGKNRSRRKKAMARLGHAQLDSRNRPLFLVLTATQRKAEVVRQEFLKDDGRPPAFAPEVRVFSEYLEHLALRHASGKAVLSESARAQMALSQLASDNRSTDPSLAEAESLARAHSLWGESLLGPDAIALPTQVRTLFQGLTRDISSLPFHTSLQSALLELGPALASPSEALKQELQRFASVVIDDILQLSPLRQGLLVSLCRTWEQLGTDVVVCFESPRSMAGSEVGAFFNFDPLLASAFPLRAFDASKALRCSLFEHFIGQGDGRICIASADGAEVVDPGLTPGPTEERDLSGHVYSHDTAPVESKTDAIALLEGRVSLFECPDSHAEHRNIAANLRALIQSGAQPADCCVAIADLERQLPVLTQVFRDFGLAFDVATGPSIASLPLPALLLSIPKALEQPAGALCLLQALQTDLVHTPAGLDLSRLWAACRTTGIYEGAPEDWLTQWQSQQFEFAEQIEPLALAYQAFFEKVDLAFGSAQTPAAFEEALLETSAMLGLPGTSIVEGGSLKAVRLGYLGWIRATERIEAWRKDLQPLANKSWSRGELLGSLTRAFQASHVAIEPRRDDAVKVVGILELRGLTPQHLFLGNLVRSSFPTPRGLNVFLPDEAGRRLEAVDPMSEARYLLMSALRNALGDGDIKTLTLSWPSTSGGRDTVPASALQDLLSVQTSHPDGLCLGDMIVKQPEQGECGPLSKTDLLASHARTQRPPIHPGLNLSLLKRQQACVHARNQDTFTAYDGLLSHPPTLPPSIGPTGVESYIKCSAKHWFARVLRLSSDIKHEPQVPAGVRGTAMHQILERYEKEGCAGLDSADTLHSIALAVFTELAVGYTGDPLLLHIERDRMVAGLVDDAPGGPLKAWLDLETSHQDWRTAEASELAFEDIPLGPVTLRGAIDRVDRLPTLAGHLVIDFKTGAVPSASHVQTGLAFQPVAYLEATARMWPGEAGIAAYMSVGKAGSVSFNTWVGDPQLIESLVPKRRRRSAVALDNQQRKALMDYAATSMERLHRGVFHTTLSSPEEAGCTHCDFRRICRVNRTRNQRIAEAGGDLQKPFEVQET